MASTGFRWDRLALLCRWTGTLVWSVALRRGGGGATRLAAAGWRRALPCYWAAASALCAAAVAATGVTPVLAGVMVVAVVGVCGAWPATSRWVRGYRLTVAGYLGGWTVVAAEAGVWSDAALALLVWPTLALGWPWWWHAAHQRGPASPKANPQLTRRWAGRWQTRVVDAGIAKHTVLVAAACPRPHVVEAELRLSGGKLADVFDAGPAIETALELDEGALGFRRTGKAARLGVVLVERSYIADPIGHRYSYRDGRFTAAVYADGTHASWVHLQPGSGAVHGLVVGSTSGGKSKALSVIIAEVLHGGCPVIIGDPQNGQSLPGWRGVVAEYHDTPEAVAALLERVYAEVMARSKLLAEHGIDHFDADDPRVVALGLTPLTVVCDEIQLVLAPRTPTGRAATDHATKIANLGRKTGVSLDLATQLPQVPSLGNSFILRDALVAGNCLVLRLSNKGSGPTVLPPDFVGDPCSIPPEIEVDGQMVTTAGYCYLRNGGRAGMLARVPLISDREISRSPRIPFRWLVPAGGVQEQQPVSGEGGTDAAFREMIGKFGVTPPPPPPAGPGVSGQRGRGGPARKWIIDCLRVAPQSAKALLSRADCPVSQSQLYAHLKYLSEKDLIVRSGDTWKVT